MIPRSVATVRPAVYEIALVPLQTIYPPHETTSQDSPDLAREGAGLPCPGTSVVADSGVHGEGNSNEWAG